MKSLISLIVLAAILMVGCNDDSSILEPTNDFTDASQLNKGRVITPRYLDGDGDLGDDKLFLDDSVAFVGNVNIMDISQGSTFTLFKERLSKYYTFNGSEGGKIIQKYTWTSGEDTLKLEAYLTIPPGAYEGDLTFELVFDPQLLSMELHPTPFYFDKPVILTMKYKGIPEYVNITADELDFKYYHPNGSYEEVEYGYIEWDPIKRDLKVFDAELHHFSRYGWTRKKETLKDDNVIYDEI